jgi:hypothetical protein
MLDAKVMLCMLGIIAAFGYNLGLLHLERQNDGLQRLQKNF